MSSTSIVRFPDTRNRDLMTKRAWWLVGLNILIPGSAQALAGNRRLGRFGLATTLLLWALLVVGIVVAIFWRPLLTQIATSVVALWILQVLLVFYAVLWVVLTLDTLRLARLVRAAPPARPAVAALAIVALVVVAGTAGYTASVTGSLRGLLSDVFSGGQVAAPVDGRYNILLLGGDADPDHIGLRPDSISVVSIDATTGQVSMVGIPRNLQDVQFAKGSPLWSAFPDGYDCGDDCLVNALYTYGEDHPELYPDAVKQKSRPGIEATEDAVEGVLGITIQYYVLIDMVGFVDLIDALGGIDVDSTGRYPFGGGVNAAGQPVGVKRWIEPGPQHMDGITALWYARARHGTSDYDRMARQRQVEEAVLKQVDPQNLLLRFQAVAKASAALATTDIPQPMLSRFVDLGMKARGQPTKTLDLVPAAGYEPDHPDFARIRSDVAAFLTPASAAPRG